MNPPIRRPDTPKFNNIIFPKSATGKYNYLIPNSDIKITY